MSTTETLLEAQTVLDVQTDAKVTLAKPLLNFDDNGKSIFKVPSFSDPYEERKWAKEMMAGAFRVFGRLGYGDGAAGHISLRDPVNPHHFWINPYAKHYSLMTASDLVAVNEEGEAVEPTDKIINTAGFMIHSALHTARPDINVAIHLHTPYGRAWAAFGRPVEMITQDACYFYDDLSVYTSYGGISVAKEEGQRIAASLGAKNKNAILMNHGILACGGSIGEAAAYFVALERACETQLLAEAAAANGVKKVYVDEEEARKNKDLITPGFMHMQFVPEYELVLKERKGDFLL